MQVIQRGRVGAVTRAPKVASEQSDISDDQEEVEAVEDDDVQSVASWTTQASVAESIMQAEVHDLREKYVELKGLYENECLKRENLDRVMAQLKSEAVGFPPELCTQYTVKF